MITVDTRMLKIVIALITLAVVLDSNNFNMVSTKDGEY
jgi:hypothetical protein